MEQSEQNRPEVPKETKEEVHNAMRIRKLYCTVREVVERKEMSCSIEPGAVS